LLLPATVLYFGEAGIFKRPNFGLSGLIAIPLFFNESEFAFGLRSFWKETADTFFGDPGSEYSWLVTNAFA
jgi:hypothetical protein